MEEKVTAVYLLVWKHELAPEDGDNYERMLEVQKQKCLDLIRKRGIDESKVVFYRSRNELFQDIERDRVARLVVHDRNRLAATPGDLEGALYELEKRIVELLPVVE